jgi:DUF1365 family protein
MEIIPQIFNAKVMHKRLFPKINRFVYNVYYFALPLSFLDNTLSVPQNFSYNKLGILSFYDKDHGNKDGKNLNQWIREILEVYDLNNITNEIILISMPRIFGYVFNPVSFWFCLDIDKNIRAVLCEVNNTFGETHYYLCANDKGKIINSDDYIETQKLFHVSPFLERKGYYKFRFDLKQNKLGIWIDFYNAQDKKQLITSLIGDLTPLNKKNLRKNFWKYPLITLKTICLIHWQALKIILKGIKYIPKPKLLKQKLSSSLNIKKT